MNKNSFLLNKYLDLYKKKPSSRVFAPLAEVYRKLGMIDEAYKVLKSGLRYHPDYALGYFSLAHCYYDQEKFEQAYNTIRPFVKDHLDNISIQKLYANICTKLGFLEEALETYKYLLYLNPKDDESAEAVNYYESQLVIEPHEIVTTSQPESFSSEDDWVEMSFARDVKVEEEDTSVWEVQSVAKEEVDPLLNFKEEIFSNNINLKTVALDDEFYKQEFDDEEEGVLDEVEVQEPIITHTLADLYLKQNHFEKAKEFLLKILEHHPGDQETLRKLDEVEALENEFTSLSGEDKLLNLVENVQIKKDPKEEELINKLENFLESIQSRASVVLSNYE